MFYLRPFYKQILYKRLPITSFAIWYINNVKIKGLK